MSVYIEIENIIVLRNLNLKKENFLLYHCIEALLFSAIIYIIKIFCTCYSFKTYISCISSILSAIYYSYKKKMWISVRLLITGVILKGFWRDLYYKLDHFSRQVLVCNILLYISELWNIGKSSIIRCIQLW